jgi:uncharacterized protein YbcI
MKTQGEIESEISECMGRFEQEYMGRGPKDVRAHLIGDLIVVRLSGVLTTAEQHLVRTLPGEKGRDLLKEVRSRLIEIARPTIEAMIKGIGARVGTAREVFGRSIHRCSASPAPRGQSAGAGEPGRSGMTNFYPGEK